MKELLAKIGKEKIIAAVLAIAAGVGFLNKEAFKAEYCGSPAPAPSPSPVVIEQAK